VTQRHLLLAALVAQRTVPGRVSRYGSWWRVRVRARAGQPAGGSSRPIDERRSDHARCADGAARQLPGVELKTSLWITTAALVGAGSAALWPARVQAQAAQDGGWSAHHERGRASSVDWIEHTQATLDELKHKLSLDPAQGPAWDTWSGGVLTDAHHQLESKASAAPPERARPHAASAETTPDQMARGIERLRAQASWMQQHLGELEAAQLRTRTFYDKLDGKQQTIFDLYWHEMHHRMSGDDGRWGMGGMGGMGSHREPASITDAGDDEPAGMMMTGRDAMPGGH